MKKTLALTTLLATIMMSGCTSMGAVADGKSSGSASFDEAVKPALEKNTVAIKAGYAWTSNAMKDKYGHDTNENGKLFKTSGYKMTLVEVAIFEGEQALKKGDEETAMKKAKLANELADAQMQQEEVSSKYQTLWK